MSRTPYDPHHGPVNRVYASLGTASPTTGEVIKELRKARRFRYHFDKSRPYVPLEPSVTESKRSGDCKAKSLWLANELGDNRARYVVGKAKKSSKISHAWLLWQSGGKWYILDPTTESSLVTYDKVSGKKWFPHYSFSRSKYLHPSYDQYFAR